MLRRRARALHRAASSRALERQRAGEAAYDRRACFHEVPEADRQAFFRRAMEHGERAMALDPDNADAHLQFAHAAGRYAESLGAMQALRGGYAGRMREAMERAVELAPDMAQAHLSLGAWHANVVAQAGGLMARAFGATRKKATEHLERALALAPEQGLNYEWYGASAARAADRTPTGRRALLVRALDAARTLSDASCRLATARLAATRRGGIRSTGADEEDERVDMPMRSDHRPTSPPRATVIPGGEPLFGASTRIEDLGLQRVGGVHNVRCQPGADAREPWLPARPLPTRLPLLRHEVGAGEFYAECANCSSGDRLHEVRGRPTNTATLGGQNGRRRQTTRRSGGAYAQGMPADMSPARGPLASLIPTRHSEHQHWRCDRPDSANERWVCDMRSVRRPT